MTWHMAASCNGPVLEEQVPPMAITNAARDWVIEDRKCAARCTWPFPSNATPDLADFMAYLRGTLGLLPVTVRMHHQRLLHFFSLLELPPEFSHVGCMAGLFTTGMVAELLGLPILDPSLGTTGGIVTTVCHFCKHVLLVCARKRYTEAARCIVLLREEVLMPQVKRANRQRRVSLARKRSLDAQRIARLPSSGRLRTATQAAMVDMFCIHCAYVAATRMPRQVKRAANVIMLGLAFTTTYAGRPGEWQRLPLQVVLECLAAGSEVLVMAEHKTSAVFGSLGRYLPPCLQQAMRLFVQLPRSGSAHFFEPCKQDENTVQANSLLRKFGAVYLPEHQHPEATLMRKLFASAIEDEDYKEKAAQLVADMDGHSKEVARRHYVLSNPSSDAKVGQSLYKQMFGAPEGWPSHDTCVASAGQSIERLKAGFFRYPSSRSASRLEKLVLKQCSAHLPRPAPAKQHARPPALRAPVLTASPVTPEKKPCPRQLSPPQAAASVLETPRKRRRCMLTAGQQEYVSTKCIADTGDACVVPHKSFFDDLRDDGIRAGILPSACSAEGLRSFARKHARTAPL